MFGNGRPTFALDLSLRRASGVIHQEERKDRRPCGIDQCGGPRALSRDRRASSVRCSTDCGPCPRSTAQPNQFSRTFRNQYDRRCAVHYCRRLSWYVQLLRHGRAGWAVNDTPQPALAAGELFSGSRGGRSTRRGAQRTKDSGSRHRSPAKPPLAAAPAILASTSPTPVTSGLVHLGSRAAHVGPRRSLAHRATWELSRVSVE